MNKIGYYNYYNNPHRYSPKEVEDSYQKMVDRYNGDKLYANNEDPYSEENLANRKLDESLVNYAASVRNRCSSEWEVHKYLSRKYFGTDDFAYTKKWDDPETYAMFKNDYNAICYGTVGYANMNDPRISGKVSNKTFEENEAIYRASKQRIISNQFKNLLNNNGINLKDNSTYVFSINPYSYNTDVNNNKNEIIAELIEKLINSKDNSKQLFTWGLYDTDTKNADSLSKWRAYHNVKEYTGLDISELNLINGKFYTDDGQDLLEILKEGILKSSSVGNEFKGVAFDYVSSQIAVVAEKGWDNIADIKMNIAYSENTGFYYIGTSK